MCGCVVVVVYRVVVAIVICDVKVVQVIARHPQKPQILSFARRTGRRTGLSNSSGLLNRPSKRMGFCYYSNHNYLEEFWMIVVVVVIVITLRNLGLLPPTKKSLMVVLAD